MQSSYDICNCGYPSDNHDFKHPFTKLATINVETQEKNDKPYKVFVADANQWPTKSVRSKCTIPQCNRVYEMHKKSPEDTDAVLQHEWKGDMLNERIINISLPKDAPCNSCGLALPHNVRHFFSTRVKTLNLTPHDKVTVCRADGFAIDPRFCLVKDEEN